MRRKIRVTGGHALDSYHRYKDDVQYMVLYTPLSPEGKKTKNYQCIRLFVNSKAMEALERLDACGEIKIVALEVVQNGEIIWMN